MIEINQIYSPVTLVKTQQRVESYYFFIKRREINDSVELIVGCDKLDCKMVVEVQEHLFLEDSRISVVAFDTSIITTHE